MGRSEVAYATSDGGIDVAYQIVGDGPVDLVFVSGFITHLDLSWDLPHFSWLADLDGVARVITFDKRGTGLSDRSLGFGSLEERAADVRAVMDAAGSERAFLMGVSEGGPLSLLTAASLPERVTGLVLFGTGARFSRAPDYPFGIAEETGADFVEFVASRWGTGRVFSLFLETPPDPDAARPMIARFERNCCTPQMAAEIMRHNLAIDARWTLPSITTPTLVVHADGDPIVPPEIGRYLADHIDGARMTWIPGDFHGPWAPEGVAAVREAVLGFLAEGGAPARPAHRVLSTVMFTDIVDSTRRADAVGDHGWKDLLDHHDRVSRSQVERHGGRLVKTTGDGILATFDGPGRGIACAREIATALRPHDLHLRAGVHTGEVELRGDDVTGMAVVIASRVCDLAGPDEVLVTRTVKELVTGSGLTLAERGTHRLKSVPDDWQLFAVAD